MKILLSLLFLIPFSLLAQPWDLVRCIDQAQNNNLTIKQAELSVEQQKMTAQVAKKQQFPTVNGSIGQNFNFGRSIDPFTNTFENTTIRANNASVSGSGILYAGGRVRNNIQAEQLNLQASELDFKAIQNNIALQVTNAYLSVVFAKEALRIAQERSLRTNEQAERMKKLVDAGANSKDNYLNLKAQLAQEKRNVVSAENNLTLSKLTLEQLMQLPHNEGFDIVYPAGIQPNSLPAFSIDQVVKEALETQPEVKREMERLKAAEKLLNVAKASALPTLSAFGSVSTVFSSAAKSFVNNGFDTVPIGYVFGSQIPVMTLSPRITTEGKSFSNQFTDNLGSSLGFNLSIPLFTAGNVQRSITSAKINVERAKLNQLQTNNNLYQNIAQAVTNYQAAQKDYDADLAAMEAQKESFGYADKRFQEGMLNTVDYLNLKNNLIAAESNLLQSKYRLWLRLKILEFYQGKPLQF